MLTQTPNRIMDRRRVGRSATNTGCIRYHRYTQLYLYLQVLANIRKIKRIRRLYVYRKKLFRTLISITYSKVIEIGDDKTVLQVQSIYFLKLMSMRIDLYFRNLNKFRNFYTKFAVTERGFQLNPRSFSKKSAIPSTKILHLFHSGNPISFESRWDMTLRISCL